MNEEKLKYPIGKFQMPETYDVDTISKSIDVLEAFPADLSGILEKMDTIALEKTYRPGGWTGAQVVHHVADSHMNGLIRTKWTLTEDEPTIKAYDEKKWAELPDGKSLNVFNSLAIIKGVHSRWTQLLRTLKEEDFNRTFIHPEAKKTYHLYQYIALYDWHSRHHLAHLQLVIDQV